MPIVRGAAQNVLNKERMEKRVHDLEKENREAKLAIREIFETNNLSREMIKKFLPDVAMARKQKEMERISADAQRLVAEKKLAEAEAEKARVEKIKADRDRSATDKKRIEEESTKVRTEKPSTKQKETTVEPYTRKSPRR